MSNRDKRMTLRLTEGEYKAIEQIAKSEGLSLATYIRVSALRAAHRAFMENVDVLKAKVDLTGDYYAGTISWVEAYYARLDEWERLVS